MLFRNFAILGVLLFMMGCASKLQPNNAVKSYAHPPHTTGKLAKFLNKVTANKPNQTGVYTLEQGTDAFVSRLSLINAASNSIDLQYYIYNKDITANQINFALYQAAERGVQIRILLDDLKAPDKSTRLRILNQHKNVEIRLFNPSPNRQHKSLGFLTDFERLNSRMHNKSLTVDSLASIIGGRNIGDEYFSASHEVEFGDFDLVLIGSAVDGINTQFDDYWNSEHSYPLSNFHQKTYSEQEILAILVDWDLELTTTEENNDDYINALRNTALVEDLADGSLPWFWGEATVLYDPPEKISQKAFTSPLLDELEASFASTKQHLFIISPYFVPGKGGTKYLKSMTERGVKVTVLTNSLAATDVVAVHSGYAPYRKELLRSGIMLYETKVNPRFKPKAWRGSTQASLHAKSIIFDKHTTFVGSLNLDQRSFYINTEIGVLFENPELSSQLVESVKNTISNSAYQVQLVDDKIVWYDMASKAYLHNEPDASIWRKIGAWFIGLLPLEDQL